MTATQSTGQGQATASDTASAFGTQFGPRMGITRYDDGAWTPPDTVALGSLDLHPATHALHYGSSCFEGLKAHRGADGVVRLFRADRHAARLGASAALVHLPVPPADLVLDLLVATTRANLEVVPDAPGSLYLRPVLMGTDLNIGAASSPSRSALLHVLASPVGDYFPGGLRPLGLKVETDLPRTTPQFGQVKTGANYAMALSTTLDARAQWGVDQVLFAADGRVSETGASNVLLLDRERVVTPSLDGGFLHGVTRDALLTLARDRGLAVEEREVTVPDLRAWITRPDGEVALSGTAAVLAPVGWMVIDGEELPVGDGGVGPTTRILRDALADCQLGRDADPHGWTLVVNPA